MNTANKSNVAQLRELLVDCYNYIKNNDRAPRFERLIPEVEEALNVERTTIVTNMHPDLEHRPERMVAIFNEVVFSTMTLNAIGLKFGISGGRVGQIYHKYLMYLLHPLASGKHCRLTLARSVDGFDPTTEKSFPRGTALCVIDTAYDPNISKPLSVKEAIELVCDLNKRWDHELYKFEQLNPNRKREVPPLYDEVILTIEDSEYRCLPTKAVQRLKGPLDWIDIYGRTGNVLAAAGIKTVSDLIQKTEVEILKIPNCGPKAFEEIMRGLATYGLRLGMSAPPEKIEEVDNLYMKSVLEALLQGPVQRKESTVLPLAHEEKSQPVPNKTIVRGFISRKDNPTVYEPFRMDFADEFLFTNLKRKFIGNGWDTTPWNASIAKRFMSTNPGSSILSVFAQIVMDAIGARYKELADGNRDKVVLIYISNGPFANTHFINRDYKEDEVLKKRVSELRNA